MVSFVYGKSGTGKTEFLLHMAEEAAKNGRVFLLVPDREAVVTESKAAMLQGAGNIDVVTFARLCNYIFRKYGGLCVDYVSAGAKKLLMRGVMQNVAPVLKEYKQTNMGIYEKLVDMRTVMYQDAVSPADFTNALEQLEQDSKLGRKVSDLAAIYTAYDKEIRARYEDPDGMLSRACDTVEKNPYFENTTVLIDSFTSYSKQQLTMVEIMMRKAKDVVITLPFLPEDSRDASVHFLESTNKKLYRAAERAGYKTAHRHHLRQYYRYQNKEMAFLAENLSATAREIPTWKEKPEHIRCIRTTNIFSEAEAVALDICKNIRNGMRYRDIAVVVRDAETYTGILDAVFDKYEIPYFLSGKKDITEKPLIRFILAAYAAAERYYRLSDVLQYIKAGFAGLTPDEISILENYCVRWNIKGKLFTMDEPWTMHPDGYGKSKTETSEKRLAVINDIRNKAVNPLKQFQADNRTVKTVKERATLLFDFLCAMDIPAKLDEKSEKAKQRGDTALAMETVQIWNALMESLDQLVIVSGESEVSPSEFVEMLGIILADVDIGRIPTSVDEVTVSGANVTLPYPHKTVYLMGVTEGDFPKRIDDEGLFSEYEKAKLSSCHLDFTDRMEKRASEELYFFYRACAVPSENLVITYPHYNLSSGKNIESAGLKRIRKLFPELGTEDLETMPMTAFLERKLPSFEHLAMFDGNLKKALMEYYEADAAYGEKLRARRIPLKAETERLSEENAKTLFDGKMQTSYSRLEKYIKCHFDYFMEYELHLQDDEPAEFNSLQIGNLVHNILENTVKCIANGEEFDVGEKTEEALRTYLTTVFGENLDNIPKRLQGLFTYIEKAAKIFTERIRGEFAVSKFKPVDFELPIGRDKDAVSPVTLENEESEVELKGKIDRVDLYEDENGEPYVRVIDYKTGDVDFKMDAVHKGLNLQMLLYLFSLVENGDKKYGKPLHPAGVLYEKVALPNDKVPYTTEENCDAIQIKPIGLLVKDENVLRAMDPDLSGTYIPVTANNLKKSDDKLIAEEAFAELAEEVKQTVLRYAEELKSGIADARPMKGSNACNYCKMKSICHIYDEKTLQDADT